MFSTGFFRRIGRQVQQADVVREVQLPAESMPPGAIQQQDGMRASRHMAADLNQMQVHRLGIGLRQDKGCAGAARRTDRAEDVGPAIALIARRRGSGALFRPDVGQAALLADAWRMTTSAATATAGTSGPDCPQSTRQRHDAYFQRVGASGL